MTNRLPLKLFILSLLSQSEEGLWDYEISQNVLSEYGFSGAYWRGEVRANLTDLFSGALVEEVEDLLDENEYFGKGKILVKFRLSRFGQRRMVETGLL